MVMTITIGFALSIAAEFGPGGAIHALAGALLAMAIVALFELYYPPKPPKR